MFADFIRCTHNGTGGSGTLTLAAITGWPQVTSAFGSSGTRLVSYVINEYTDSTKAVLAKSEAGRGSIVLSTNVLTRSVVRSTWGGTTYNAANPTALSFGNTAANIDIILTDASYGQCPNVPAIRGSNWELFDTRSQYDTNISTFTMVAGTKYYTPCEFRFGKAITAIAIEATSIATTGNIRMGVYDWGTDGLPANLLTEFTSSSQIGVNTSTGIKSVTLGTPYYLPPGWYFLMMQGDAAMQIRTVRHYAQSGMGGTVGRDTIEGSKTGTYGALPSTADTSLTMQTLSGGNKKAYLFN